jgi:hypothetical protein
MLLRAFQFSRLRVDCIMVHAFELEPLESFQKLLHGESDSGSDDGRPLKKLKVNEDGALKLQPKPPSEEPVEPKTKQARVTQEYAFSD